MSVTSLAPVPVRALLEMRGISKAYGEVRANRGVDLTVYPGQIVGLLGENGSGKSTLMKVLFGMVQPDEGGVVFKGRELTAASPREALSAGIAMIHQHFTLVEAMTVAENISLGWDRLGVWLDLDSTCRMVRDAAQRYGLDVDPMARVEQLALGEKQRVEILKAILRGADLLILDEPTSILSPHEIARLLDFLGRFRAEGKGIVFITHKLGEVLEVADQIVVLRDGQVTGQVAAAEATRASLARMMVGRDLPPATGRTTGHARGPVMLAVRGLQADDASGVRRLKGASFNVHAGEVLALAGVDGNGQEELANTLAGLTAASAGRITVDGHDLTGRNARAMLDAGIAYIPADRAGTSLVQTMSIEDNLMLRDFRGPPFARRGRIDNAALRSLAQERIQRFDIRSASPAAAARTLSGGNQQKIALAREIGRQPRILIAFQPTWGLDPGATRFMMDTILRLRDAGGAVLYISSELEEVLAVGDRVGVLYDGRVLGVVDRDAVDLDQLGLAMASGLADAPPAMPSTAPQAAVGA